MPSTITTTDTALVSSVHAPRTTTTPQTTLFNFHSQLPGPLTGTEGLIVSTTSSEAKANTEFTSNGTQSPGEPQQDEAKFTCRTCGLAAEDGTIKCSICGQLLHFQCAGVQDETQIPEEVPYACPGCQIKIMFPENDKIKNQNDKKH